MKDMIKELGSLNMKAGILQSTDNSHHSVTYQAKALNFIFLSSHWNQMNWPH